MEQTQAASSAAQESPVVTPEIDIARGPLVNLTVEQRSEFRKTGELPKPPEPKIEAPEASQDKPEGESSSDIAPATEAGKDKPQGSAEKKHLTADQRKAQLRAAVEQEWEKPEPDLDKIARFTTTIDKIDAGQKRKAEPAPAVQKPQAEPPKPAEQQYTRPKPTIEDKNPDGSPKYTDWDQYNEELIDWKAEQKLAQYQQQQAQQAQMQQVASRITEARQKFGEEFDTIIDPTAGAIMNDPAIPFDIKRMVAKSDVAPELLHEIGSDSEGIDKLRRAAKTDPLDAIRHIAMLEASIKAKVTAKPEAAPQKPPVKTETRAPKPPAEIGGRGSTPPDALESAVQAQDFRAFKAEANRRHIARISGK